jgi:hypothetical protein
MKPSKRVTSPTTSSPLRSSPRSKIAKIDDGKSLLIKNEDKKFLSVKVDVEIPLISQIETVIKPPATQTRRQSTRSHPSVQRLLIDTLPSSPNIASSTTLIKQPVALLHSLSTLIAAATTPISQDDNLSSPKNSNKSLKIVETSAKETCFPLMLERREKDQPKSPLSSPRKLLSPRTNQHESTLKAMYNQHESTLKAIYAATREAVSNVSEYEKETREAYHETLMRLNNRAFLEHKDNVDIEISPKKEEDENGDKDSLINLSFESFPSIVRKSSYNLILSGSASIDESGQGKEKNDDDNDDDDDDDDNDTNNESVVGTLTIKDTLESNVTASKTAERLVKTKKKDNLISKASERSMKAFERITRDPTNLESIAEYQLACELLNQALNAEIY